MVTLRMRRGRGRRHAVEHGGDVRASGGVTVRVEEQHGVGDVPGRRPGLLHDAVDLGRLRVSGRATSLRT